jgi:cell division protein FtsB
MAAIFTLIAVYLGHHGLHGKRGYAVWQEKKNVLVALEKKSKYISSKHRLLKNKVDLLQENIDNDLLEQYMWLLFRNIEPYKKVILCA